MKNSADIAALLAPAVRHSPQIITAVVTIEDGRDAFTVCGPGDERTIFEIGSITKVFTSALLADMVRRGEVALDDPIDAFLPPRVRAPSRDGRHITLLDLATHTSGLPRGPANLWYNPFPDRRDPYRDYDDRKLYGYIGRFCLRRLPGEQFEYSNLGYALLGELLARRLAIKYEDAIRERLLRPLGMPSTTISLIGDTLAQHAIGHDSMGRAVRLWNFHSLAACGAIRSNILDMRVFLAAALGAGPEAVVAALARATTSHREIPGGAVGLGWFLGGRAAVTWHNGSTGGFRSYAGMTADRRTGVVVLRNAALGVDDLAVHLLVPGTPAPT